MAHNDMDPHEWSPISYEKVVSPGIRLVVRRWANRRWTWIASGGDHYEASPRSGVATCDEAMRLAQAACDAFKGDLTPLQDQQSPIDWA